MAPAIRCFDDSVVSYLGAFHGIQNDVDPTAGLLK